MKQYREEDLIRLAKRDHNTKRTYLLVNPLQGKHLPVSPSAALDMMADLGAAAAAGCPGAGLVIGFAETATAVAAVTAGAMGPDCRYIQTTREPWVAAMGCVGFREEHSHAADQFLYGVGLEEALRGPGGTVFVDDELSTGRTLLNVVRSLREAYPCAAGKPAAALSLINRLSPDRLGLMRSEGIECFSLLSLPMRDYTEAVSRYAIAGAPPAPEDGEFEQLLTRGGTPDPRLGVNAHAYLAAAERMAEELLSRLAGLEGDRITVIGTEETMLPGLVFGHLLERARPGARVRFHATTRSPIGICDDADYPIRSGFLLPSFYEAGRRTFLYNIEPCDAAVILTDSPDGAQAALAAARLSGVLRGLGCRRVILAREERHVRNL